MVCRGLSHVLQHRVQLFPLLLFTFELCGRTLAVEKLALIGTFLDIPSVVGVV